jgi:antitoxin MazE
MWGNSLALRIPKPFADQVGIAADAELELTLSRGRLVLAPITPATYRLDELLAGVDAKNLHTEEDFGGPAGREVW